MKTTLKLFILFLLISNTVKPQTKTVLEIESILEVIGFIENKLISSESVSIDIELIYSSCYGKSTVVSSILISNTTIKLISLTEEINGNMAYDTFSFTKKEFLDELAMHKSIVREHGYALVIGGASQEIIIECLGQNEVFYTDKGILFIQLFSNGLKVTETK